jgi:hypothetical protein
LNVSATTRISDYSIGLVRIGNEGRALLGSGTLVSLHDCRAILTAGFVLSQLPRRGRLGIALRTDLNQINLAVEDLTYAPVRTRDVELGLVILSPGAARRFDETKRFLNFAVPQNQEATVDADRVWCVNGFSSELTTTQLPLDCFDMVMGYTSVTGVWDGEIHSVVDEIKLKVHGASESGEPLRLEGVVGGGLWEAHRSNNTFYGFSANLHGIVLSAPGGLQTSGVVRCTLPTSLTAVKNALES